MILYTQGIMSSTTVLSCSCLECRGSSVLPLFYPVLVLSVEDHQFYHCFILFREEQDNTVVELMILYTQDKNRIKQW
jgi:hypothetical protein